MDYEKEFYKLMKKKEKEIDSLNIPKEGKVGLYLLISQNVQMYKQNKMLFGVYKTLEKIAFLTEKEHELKESIRRRENKQERYSLDYIPFSMN